MIHISAIPMRIPKFIARTGGYQEFIFMAVLVFPCLARQMMKEAEAAFEAAGKLRISLLPCAPLCERANPRQVPSTRQFFQNEICKWRRRFTDREARMCAFLQQDHRFIETPRDHGHERSAEAGAHDAYIEISGHRETFSLSQGVRTVLRVRTRALRYRLGMKRSARVLTRSTVSNKSSVGGVNSPPAASDSK